MSTTRELPDLHPYLADFLVWLNARWDEEERAREHDDERRTD